FIARIPELVPCTGEGATRGEALLNMERELDALLQNLTDSGGRWPVAIDDLAADSGELTLKVSRSLGRDLAFQAQVEGVELGQLAAEILAAGLEHRLRTGRPARRQHSQDSGAVGPGPGPGPGPGDEPPRRGDRHHGHDRGEHEPRWRDRGERNTA